jgi:hypothetical protein
MRFRVWLTVEDTPENRPRPLSRGRGHSLIGQTRLDFLRVNHWNPVK